MAASGTEVLPPRVQGAPRERVRLWLRLLGLTRQVETELRRRLRAEFGMTLPRFDVMAALHRENSGLMMTELSRRLKVSNGNVTGIVDRLVAEGLVLRSLRDGDRRASVVRLTEPGRLRFESIARVHNVWVDELLGGLGDEDMATVMRLFDRLRGKGGIE